jgi:hypothetical protein
MESEVGTMIDLYAAVAGMAVATGSMRSVHLPYSTTHAAAGGLLNEEGAGEG